MSARTEAGGAPFRPRRLARPLLWLLFGTTAAASLVAMASRWHWLAELFSHFRLYYLLAQGLLVVAFLNTRRHLWLALTVLLALPNAWAVGPYLLPLVSREAWGATGGSGRPQLVTVNLDYRNDDVQAVIGYLQRVAPEVIVLSEYTPAWDAALGPALAAWPNRVLRPREDPFGLAVYARAPLLDAEWLDLGVAYAANARVRLRLGGREVELYAVHTLPPKTAALAAGRNLQLERLAGRVAAASGPRIVTGDLNLTPFSPHFPSLLQKSGLVDARRAQGLHVTWPVAPVPVWIPIDHCLADPAAGIRHVRTGPDIGSDHLPLEITLEPAA